MNFPTFSLLKAAAAAAFLSSFCRAADTPVTPAWKEQHDQLVVRLRTLTAKEGAFGPAYRPLFHAALSWYELWGGRNPNPVDDGMVSPEAYANELAQSLEQGRNYFAENPDALFPLVFGKILPDGRSYNANYWIALPAGFPMSGRSFPLVIELHGAGWLGHKISFKRRAGASDPVFTVTPIDMESPWKIDFLNAYLDELIAMLPIDTDRVYLQGHSLGGEATWEWAIDNPERFAAIAPRAAIGEPYRAVRLKNVPSWVIHGGKDDVVPNGYADQMVTALQSCGAPVRFSLIKGGGHNMPPDLDFKQILAWYLRQTRSARAVPADPRDALGLNEEGFSPCEPISTAETQAWKSEPVDILKRDNMRRAASGLFQRAHDRGELVDAPVRAETDTSTHLATLWLAVPAELHSDGPADPSVITLPASRYFRFYFRGEIQRALEHARAVGSELEAGGRVLTGRVWITDLSIWHNTPGAIAEYWLETK
jgi:pimeloyl-ACP methyl ester carboxylesterase